MAMVATAQPPRRSEWARRYPPLLLLLLAAVLVLAALPSALTLPQTNPATTLEYAPVPPSDEDVPPPAGNFNQFGLGSSGNLEQGGAQGGEGAGGEDLPPPPGAPPTAAGRTPTTKRCVLLDDGIVHQTEDPLSPPCVPDFNCDDNGGATYQGVEEREIRILFYLDSGIIDVGTSRGDESRPENTYVDLFDEPEPDEHIYARVLRGWQKYFNDRYQTYCRTAHFFVYYGSDVDSGPEAKRADAADNFAKVKPFAVVSHSLASNDAYLEAMAKRGVLNFGSFIGRSLDFFNAFPKMIWGYPPPIELQAEAYADYVCRNIKPYNVTFSGAEYIGQPRKYGLIFTTDPNHPQLRETKNLVLERTEGCGVEIAETATFPQCCYAANNSTGPGGAAATYARDAMIRFSSADVTTVLWPGGIDGKFSAEAARLGYLPEWVVLGDGSTDAFVAANYQDDTAWQHSMVVSYQTRQIEREKEQCYLAYKDADPQAPDVDAREHACLTYDNLRQLFIGIQVAGPRLGPTSIDRGFHAIPRVASTNPQTPACYYNPGDYTCVKDMVPMWWDPNSTPPNGSEPGCFRMPEGGRRYIVGSYPDGEATTFWDRANDPCNGFAGRALRSLSP